MNSNKSSTMEEPSLKGLSLLTLDNPVFACYLFWASVLVIKMLLMSLLTAAKRIKNNAVANPEDAVFGGKDVQFHNPEVERVRRAHRNDMENILPYFTMALIYICTDPNPTAARILFRVAAVARIIHTLVYAVYPVPQPSRAIAFFTAFGITIYMAVDVMVNTAKYI